MSFRAGIRVAAGTIVLALAMAGASGAATTARQDWIARASDPAAAAATLAAQRGKLAPRFDDRLRYARPDGRLRAMVTTTERSGAVERLVAASATSVRWYPGLPAFLGLVTPDGLARLLASEDVVYVEPDHPLSYFLASSAVDVDARAGATGTGVWAFDAGNGLGALRSTDPALSAGAASGLGVAVAVVDGGIDRTHRDFGGFACTPAPAMPCESRVLEAVTVEQIAGRGVDPGGSLPSSDLAGGHGTHVAGIVLGNGSAARASGNAGSPNLSASAELPIGIAPQASLVSVKNGETIWAGLSSFGLTWVARNAARLGIRAVNNSWGCAGGCSFDGRSASALALRALYDAGVLVVFAAGNDGGDSGGGSLSGYAQSPYVLGVANYDDATHRLAGSSSRGSATAALPDPATWTPQSEPVNGLRRPDIAAPGTRIWAARSLTGGAASLAPRVDAGELTGGALSGGTGAYVQMTGTSMAAPHVAGAAALLFSACPRATVLDAMRALMASADGARVTTTAGNRLAQPFEVGYGGLDVRAAIDRLRATVACA